MGNRELDRGPVHLLESRIHRFLTLTVREYLRKWIPLGILIGIIGGLGAIIFQILLEFISSHLSGGSPAWFLIPTLPALGGILVGVLIERFAPEAAGHGTDSVIDALHHRAGKMRPQVVPVKVVASAITIGTGGSAGREGPIAQIGAGLASFIGTKLRLSRSDLRIFVVSGMAAGFSAIFKAPLGAAVFAMEVPYKNDLEHSAVIPSILSSVVSYLIFVPFYGTEPIFSMANITGEFSVETFPYIFLVGILVGILGVGFVKIFYFTRDYFSSINMPFPLKTGLGGLGVGILGMVLPEIMGLGTDTIEGIIGGSVTSVGILLAIIVGKMVATSFTVASGGSGGVFFPSLMIGGATGALVGCFFDPGFTPLFAVVGMGAMMAGVTKTPVATSIMVTEMVGGYTVLIPVMMASAISYIITGNQTIYEAQIAQRSFSLDISCLGQLKVHDVMRKDVVTIPEDATIGEAYQIAMRSPHYLYPVVTEGGRIVGVAPRERIIDVKERLPTASILEVLQSHYESIPADYEALTAFEIMNEKQISRMLVVDPKDRKKVVGILTRFDILRVLEHMDEHHHEY